MKSKHIIIFTLLLAWLSILNEHFKQSNLVYKHNINWYSLGPQVSYRCATPPMYVYLQKIQSYNIRIQVVSCTKLATRIS